MIGPPALIGAPSAIGLSPRRDGEPRGVDQAPAALRAQNLAERLGARDRGDVLPPDRYADLARPTGRVRNEHDVAAYSQELGARVAEASRDGDFVVLLGGDCSIMLGSLLGLRQQRAERVGLVYIDAHADFATLEESESGSACSMNLALATGRSQTSLSHLGGDRPLVASHDVVHVGARDAGGPYGHAALEPSGILKLDGPALKRRGPEPIANETLARVARADGGFWVHVDVDILDPRLMPAVDSPEPGGLTYEALVALLRPLVEAPAALGLQMTIYDPSLDDGEGAGPLADLLAAVCR